MTTALSATRAQTILVRNLPTWQRVRDVQYFALRGVLGNVTGIRYRPVGGGARDDEFRYIKAADALATTQSVGSPAPGMVSVEPQGTCDLTDDSITGIILAGTNDWQPVAAFLRFDQPGTNGKTVPWVSYTPRVAAGFEGESVSFAPLSLVIGVQAAVLSDSEIAEERAEREEAEANTHFLMTKTDRVTFATVIERQDGRCSNYAKCGHAYGLPFGEPHGWDRWLYNRYADSIECAGPGGCSEFEYYFVRGDGDSQPAS